MSVGSDTKSTKSFPPGQQNIDQVLDFDLKNIKDDEQVDVEAVSDKKKNGFSARWKMNLSDFLKEGDSKMRDADGWLAKALTDKSHKSVVHIRSKWTPKNTTQKVAGTTAAQAKDTAKNVVKMEHPQRTLSNVHDTHRPWFMRVSYYYDTTKQVYNYTTSFRMVAPVARFGEDAANKILNKIAGKSLHDVDHALVSPNLQSLDNVVDATISTVLVKLVEGQQYVLQKKNDAVVGVTNATNYTTSSAKSVASNGYQKVSNVTNYTTSSVKSVASSGYQTVSNVTEYTTSQVANVSSSAFGKVRGATVYIASHVPYLGAKIRA